MTSSYQYSPHYHNRDLNTASTPNSNNRSAWNNASFSGRGEENESLILPPISQTDSGNRLELPALSSSPLFIPESHLPPVQPELSSYRSIGNANTTTTTTASIKRPRSASPTDLSSFGPFDENNRYRSPPPLPLHSNQTVTHNSRLYPPISQQPVRGSSIFDDDVEDIRDLDWDSYFGDHSDDIDNPFQSPPRIPSRTSDTNGVVDLTDSLPVMAPPPERRRALSGTSLRPATFIRPKSPKRRKTGISSRSSKRRKTSPSKIDSEEDVEVVDLAENSNLQEYEAAKAKRQEDLIKQQNQDEATKPIKLVDFQCIICMDNPTDLTDIYSVPNAFTQPYTQAIMVESHVPFVEVHDQVDDSQQDGQETYEELTVSYGTG
ncbi:hypothetical protein SBOR_5332 [Sclerotinia borealis F-4128]|uniref:Uncharacterized protein n=1 Tax=Sclerotinia borealis (strain F-4128) TaxID=1432307 RepID=W9CHT1_SCLBF|nr:hypothetical protein SBOR_5332 [Sclerotinia borealis F-4128]